MENDAHMNAMWNLIGFSHRTSATNPTSGLARCATPLPGGKFDPATWPNTGIGRVNPDGSAGSCSACHTRHRFSKA